MTSPSTTAAASKPQTRSPHSRIRNIFEYALFRVALFVIRILPESAAYALAALAARGAYYIVRKHRERTIENVLFTGIVKTKAEARAFCIKNWIHFAKVFCDIVLNNRHIHADNFTQFITGNAVYPPEVVDFTFGRAPGQTQGRQVIIATAHYGNWEVAGQIFGYMSGRPLKSVMRPLDNPLLGDYLYRTRCSKLHQIIPQKGALKHLLRAVAEGDSLCLVADQHEKMSEGVRAKYFGHDVSVYASLAKLHLKTGLPIVVGGCRRLDDAHHYVFDGTGLINYTPTGDETADVCAITQLYMDAVERMVRLAPEQWMWAHRRFIKLRPRMRDRTVRFDTTPDEPFM